MKIVTILMSLVCLGCAEEGWTSLFDGETLKGWTDQKGKPVEEGGWVAQDGVLFHQEKGGNLFSEKEYGDFEFRWEWKISEAGNSGVKYRTTHFGKYILGPEYQILDDDKHPDGKVSPKRQSASLYDVVAADPEKKKLKPVGEWNQARILVKGNHFQHFLNGEKVIDVTVGTEEWKKLLQNSKYKKKEEFGANSKGRIMLQDHVDQVWFRKLEIKSQE